MHLIIGLGELNNSGHVGTAWLGSDGDQTQVVINLVEPDEMASSLPLQQRVREGPE